VLAAAGELEAAEAELQQASSLDPDLAPAWHNLAVVLERSGRADAAAAARREWQRAAHAPPRGYPYGVGVGLLHPGTRPLIPDIPPGCNVPPPTSMEYVEQYLEKLITSRKDVHETYTYGEDLEKQIDEVIRMYREEGLNTNQAYMAVGDASSILLQDPQCLRGIDTRIRYGKLHFVLYFRSWDLWGGMPANLAGIQNLKEYMAGEIGVKDGEMIVESKGLHLYGYAEDLAKLRCMRE